MTIKKDIVWRVAFVYITFLIFGLSIIGRIIYLQTFERKVWSEKGAKMTLKDIEIEPNRGDIYASDGKLLASSIPHYEIRMDLGTNALTDKIFSKNIDSLALCLSKLFRDKSKDGYKSMIIEARHNNERFFLIHRKVAYEEMKQMKSFPIFRMGKNTGGLIVIQDNMRYQPYGNLASRTIGYLTKSESGNTVGIEGAYDKFLHGVKGIRLMEQVSGGIWMPVHDGNEVNPKDGMDVVSTINVEFQDVATEALYKQLITHNAHHGSAILMEVATGEIKAITNLERDPNGGYSENYNYAVGENIEPGSTFKLPVLIAALEDGYIEPDDTIDTGKGKVTFYDKTIHDDDKKGYGRITIQRIFEVSSNVGMAKIITAHYTGKEKQFVGHLYDMHLNEPLYLDISGEAKPEIKYPGDKFWSGISLPMMAHGYEVQLTPLQTLTFYNAIANNGRMMKPRFVKEIRFRGNLVERFDPVVIDNSICSSSTIRKVKKMLEGVVLEGTAKNLRNNVYGIAGKTGTAQIANRKFGYVKQYVASFVGYFPAENPRYSCIVTISSPSNNVYYGNLVAGPVFKEISDKVYATSLDMHEPLEKKGRHDSIDLPYTKAGNVEDLETVLDDLDIKTKEMNSKKTDWVATSKKDETIELYSLNVIPNLVPNVVGMGMKDALYLLENTGLRVDVHGRGTVTGQSLLPGTRVTKGTYISIEMSQTQ